MADITEGSSTPENVTTTDHLQGTRPGVFGSRYRYCAVCGLEFPENTMTFFEGKWYGNECGDSKDIASILILRRGRRK